MELEDLRAEIDRIDAELVNLLNQRAEVAREVGRIKRRDQQAGAALPVYQPHREAEVLAHVKRVSRGPLPDEALVAIWREIFSSSRALQRPLRVGYLGPAATFTYEAATRHFGSSATYLPARTIADVFHETKRRNVDYGVVPIENSTEGAVPYTFDQLLETDLQICAEIELPVSHNLLSSGPLDQITRVYSHPQALAQCRRWLSDHLARAAQIETPSTAAAAQLAREPGTAAIATEAASEVYDLPILVPHIEDASTNATRFLVIGPSPAKRSGQDRTAVVFGVKDHAGALQAALQTFAASGINLSRIESRPSRRRRWEYVFFVDLVGHPEDPPVAQALDRLEDSASFVRVLGSWPIIST